MMLAYMPGGWEIGLVAVVFLLLFGPTMLPKMFRSLGASIREFKWSVNEAQKGLDELADPLDPKREKKF